MQDYITMIVIIAVIALPFWAMVDSETNDD
jgi:hypothetical protein